MHYDFIIVDRGSAGAAASFYAARAGLKVLMLDSLTYQEGTHYDDRDLMHHSWNEGEKYIPLARRAELLWDELQSLSKKRIVERTGVVNIGPAHSTFLATILHSSTALSQMSPERLEGGNITRRWPEIRVRDDCVAPYESDAGTLHSETAIGEWTRLAQESGCVQLFNCPVTVIHSKDSCVSVTTENGVFTANKALIGEVALMNLFPDLPIAPERKVTGWFQADGRYSSRNHFPAFSVELPNGDRFYGFPAENNALKIVKHNGGQKIDSSEQCKPFGGCAGDGSEAFPLLRHFLQSVGGCLYGKACAWGNSPDGEVIVDILPGQQEIMVICGTGGHGFQFVPALGEAATQFAAGQPLSADFAPFFLSRFQ